MAKGNSGKGKGQKKEDLERKRDERARRRSMKKEKEIEEYSENDENFVSFKNQLEAIGLKLKDILGDGNCLFRALGDQLNGDHTAHAYHRKHTVQYMKDHREDFEPFMEDGITYEKHLKELSKLGTYGGNDSIVAFARNNGVDVVIHQLNNPRWVIHGSEYSKAPKIIELHLAYHNGEHYSSVRRLSDPDNGPAWENHSKYNMAQPSSNKDKETTTNSNNNKSKKKKKEKKNDKSPKEPEPAAACFADDREGLIPTVMNTTGCQDMQLIIETLEENNYDIDATVGYILQLMSIMEEQNSVVQSTASSSTAETENIPSSTENIENDTSLSRNLENITDKKDSKAGLNPIEESTNDGNCNNKECKDSLNEFVDNLKETISEIDCEKSRNNMMKQGARPKENTKKNSAKPAPHLSNRQRKDLAKQEKKKRREERRKDEEQQGEDNHSETALENKSNSLVVDLGAVRI